MRTFKSAQKSAFANKSAQKSTLKSTYGSSGPIWCFDYMAVAATFFRFGSVHGEELAYVLGMPLVGGTYHFVHNYTNQVQSLGRNICN